MAEVQYRENSTQRTGGTGIYRTTENSASMGTQLVATNDYDYLFDIKYLPNASGILFAITDNWGNSSNIYRYTFATYGGASDLWTIGINGSNPQLFKTNGAHPTWNARVVQPPLRVYLPLVTR